MKQMINLSLALLGALLLSIPSFSRVKNKYTLTKSKKELIMENQNVNRNKATVHKLYEEILNTGKLDLLKQIISEAYSGPRGLSGPSGFAETVTPVIQAFPDIKWTIEDLIAEGDKVMVRWSWKGTNKVSFDGFPPSNKEVIHNAINIFQFSDGKIMHAWMQADRLGFYQQIAVIPADAITPRAKK